VHIDALLALARAWEAGRADPAGAAPAAHSAHA
jgi:hypothetical protein